MHVPHKVLKANSHKYRKAHSLNLDLSQTPPELFILSPTSAPYSADSHKLRYFFHLYT